MKIAVLGGLGFQGRAALADLNRCPDVHEIVCADIDADSRREASGLTDLQKLHFVSVDGASVSSLKKALTGGVDAAIDLLPLQLMPNAFEAALQTGVHLVSTNYGGPIFHLHERAADAGVSLMPECGLDPGIDLVIFGHAVKQFDRLKVLNSYCGGIPEKSACDNPLNYKISWNWDMVLRSQKRDSVFICNGRKRSIPAAEQHENDLVHQINFPGLGALEAVPNGNAVFYTDLLGISDTIENTGRFALRWPGWCAFWAPLKKLGFLSDQPVEGFSSEASPHRFLVKLLEPQLQYRADQKDVVAMYNLFEGVKDGRKKKIVSTLRIERDLDTGLLAMSIGVGYTASIVAQMLGKREIGHAGVLNPAVHIPYHPFMKELEARGVDVVEKVHVDR